MMNFPRGNQSWLVCLFLLMLRGGELQAATQAWVVLDTPSAAAYPGASFTTDLKVSAYGGNIGALDVTLRYDPAVLRPSEFIADAGSWYYPNCFAQPAAGASGQFRVACFQAAKPGSQTTPVLVGSVRWQVIGAAGAPTEIGVAPTTIVDAQWGSVEVAAYGQSITIYPVLAAISRTQGPANSQIVITGRGFLLADPGSMAIYFNGVRATIVAISDTEIVVTVPTGASTGPITITTSGGTVTCPFIFSLTPPADETALTLPPGGAASTASVGPANDMKAGYAILSVKSGAAPYGTAVFSYMQNGVVVSEVGVPASPPTVAARFFVDSRRNVSTPGKGPITIATGLAVVNQGNAAANLNLNLRDSSGLTLAQGVLRLGRGEHMAKYLDQLGPDFVLPPGFAENGLGSLEITCDQPVSILALRLTNNQRGDFLMTTTAIADLSKPLPAGAVAFPQVADGGGYQTTLILLNTSKGIETGVVRFYDGSGAPLAVRLAGGGAADYQFPYSLLPGGFLHLVTDGSPATASTGWAQVTPEDGSNVPVGMGAFSLTQGGVLVSETGVPSAKATTHARIYVDRTGRHDAGLAIVNPGNAGIRVTATAFQSDGVTHAGISSDTIDLPRLGHEAKFAWQLIPGLPDDFTGVLDLRASNPFAALTMRFLTNERGEFLMTTFPIADFDQAPPAPLVFPQIVDGGGYHTQFILLNAGGASSAVTLRYLGNDGSPIAIGLDANGTTVPRRFLAILPFKR